MKNTRLLETQAVLLQTIIDNFINIIRDRRMVCTPMHGGINGNKQFFLETKALMRIHVLKLFEN